MPYAKHGMISRSHIDGGIEITDEQYRQALAGMLNGMEVTIVDGAVEMREPVVPTPNAPAEDPPETAARAQRNALLSASDWVVVRAMESGAGVPADWLTYRTALRDIPEQPGFPETIDWPVAPQE